MKKVGLKLEYWALQQSDLSEIDVFARSAFNRFYYAAFLVTRKMLGSLDPTWVNIPHRDIPDLIEGAVKKPIKLALKASSKNGLISSSEKSQILTNLNKSTSDLANLLRAAYDIRIVADYEPEIPIQKNKNVLILKNYKLTSACKWPDKVEQYTKTILKAWESAGLA